MTAESDPSAALAVSITKNGSRQTYFIIRWLVDRDLAEDAFRAYAYYRWLDDVVDVTLATRDQSLALVEQQRALMERAYQGDVPQGLAPEEELLVSLIRRDRRVHGGLESYLRNMMAVLEFDARRRGRLISGDELAGYTRSLSLAVTDGLSYFIGHRHHYPQSPARYLAVAAAHISHMLRDAVGDLEAGYYNIPAEVLEAQRISPADVAAPAYRQWVLERVELARHHFREGKRYISRLTHLRSRLAGYAYCARFESLLDTIEGDGFLLRPDYKNARGPASRRKTSNLAGGSAVLRPGSSQARDAR
jgi:phytoene/squalene synthetase